MNTETTPPPVYWAVLWERYLAADAVAALLDVAYFAGMRGYTRIHRPYGRTDLARNQIVAAFRQATTDPNAMLVMLDNDHLHPPGVVSALTRHDPELGIVAGLTFRRSAPYDPLWYVREEATGRLLQPAEWEAGNVYECDAAGTGVIGIRRWVFDALEGAGHTAPFFRYEYPEGVTWPPTEDMYFAGLCEKAGIHQYVDTGIISPHLGMIQIDESTWRAQYAADPNLVQEVQA